MPQSNKEIASKNYERINDQLVPIEKQEPVRGMTKEELSRLKVTRRRIPAPSFQWFTKIISDINLFISNKKG